MSRTPMLVILLLCGCSDPGGPYPSLQPRPAESIDPRLPVAPLAEPSRASAETLRQLEQLIAVARSGESAFAPAIAEAERLAAAAGAPQSESWITAQQALSAASAARAPTVRALGDADALVAVRLDRQHTIAPADLAAAQQAADTIARIDSAQQVRIAAVSRRLGR